ncbi:MULTISPECIES: tetratricopeptide repeat protein [unclassified Sphingomonas]|uniref:tetratricopeptide repeat protein n=1 Tax=unclassified Sphingomonas TaxID=196159 RepID=UPI00082E1AD6|nr:MULTISPECIES: hypothetical protein [unclassified Sphingomonas]
MLVGWLILAGLAAAAGAALWALGFSRTLASLAGAAMMLAAAGYALQGRPALPGSPTGARASRGQVDPDTVSMRLKLFGRFGSTAQFFVAADALTRVGSPGSAIRLLIGALQGDPRNVALWSGLGLAYLDHDRDILSPPAQFAFEQAIRVDPSAPGGYYFYGVGRARTGDFDRARSLWRAALERTAPGSNARAAIAERLAMLDDFAAMQALAPARP